MMVTGDYHHTAIAVARGVGIVPQGGQLVIIQAKSEKQVLPRMPSHVPPALGAAKTPANPYQPGPISYPCSPPRAASPLLVSPSEKAKPSPEEQHVLSFEGQAKERRQRVCDGLTFMVNSGNDFEDWDPHHALISIAQARFCTHALALLSLQSQVTGSAICGSCHCCAMRLFRCLL